jgi:hypothetical protein
MKKWLLIISCLAVLFYVGEDSGQFVSGIQGEAKMGIAYLNGDIRSYIAGLSNVGFQPNKVMYRIGGGIEWLRFYHECSHDVDRVVTGYPIINYVEVRI